MDLNSKVTQLEDEIKVLKKEVQAVLLDLRENMLNRENPFSPQPAFAAVPAIAISQSLSPAEEKKSPQTEVSAEAPSATEEAELPPAITGAFQADEPVEFPDKKETAAGPAENDQLVLAWKPDDDSRKEGCAAETKNAPGGKHDRDILETVTGLVGWVESSVARLGVERTQAILDISEMMGSLSTEMKNILVKFIRPGPEPQGKVAFKDYMASLIELAGLLGTKNDPDNVLFYTLYHGMYSMTEGKEKNG